MGRGASRPHSEEAWSLFCKVVLWTTHKRNCSARHNPRGGNPDKGKLRCTRNLTKWEFSHLQASLPPPLSPRTWGAHRDL